MPRPLLFVGDIHLGRRPTGLDSAFRDLGLDPRDLGPHAAWQATVRHAIHVRARAVVLAGDVVDGEKDRFEAYGQLEAGARRLHEAGIPLFAVAGNHDVLVLPRLAEAGVGLRLLGAAGAWQTHALVDDEAPVDLLGWSFPTRVVRADPLAHPSLAAALEQRRPEARVLGVLHGDLDVPASSYAPIDPRRLEATPVDAWFLGHVHQPHPLSGTRPVGYLGSLVGLDPGEAGPRGPWEVRVGEGVSASQVPLVPLRWERVHVDLPDAPDADAVVEATRAAVRQHVEADPTLAASELKVIVVRAVLKGRPARRAGVRSAVALRDPEGSFEVQGVKCLVESYIDATRPAIDVDRVAEEPTPAGWIARRLIQLREGGADDLEREADRVLGRFRNARWAPDADPRPLPPTRKALEQACWSALEALVDLRASGVR